MAEPTLSEKLRTGNLFAEQCPSRDVLKHVTSRWGVLILVALREGTHRFSDLRRKMGGVSEKMLAQSLQALEQDGFIDRVSYPVVPPHVEYSLTPLGLQVSEKVAALADWIEVNLPSVLANHGEGKCITPCSPGKRSAAGEQALLAQIQLINGEADIIGGHLAHWILRFLFDKRRGFVARRGLKTNIQRRVAVDRRQTPVVIRRRMDRAFLLRLRANPRRQHRTVFIR